MDWDDAYQNGKYISGGDEYLAMWQLKSSAFRAAFDQNRQQLGLPYGSHPREVFDLFLPETPAKGVVILFTAAIGSPLILRFGLILLPDLWRMAGLWQCLATGCAPMSRLLTSPKAWCGRSRRSGTGLTAKLKLSFAGTRRGGT